MSKAPQLKILITEDNIADCLIINKLVRDQGYQTVVAHNGIEAIDLFVKEKPDIILMDALMPKMDGFEAVKRIKSLVKDDFLPIIFLTSLNDDISLVSCLEAGGDDFLSKPYSPIVIAAKIQAFTRMITLHRTVQAQRDEITSRNEYLLQEQKIAKEIFDNVAHLGCLGASNIKHLLSPMSVFNGDVLLASRKPSGGMIVFLGDFTGHGLPAAVGAMPVAEIFYDLVAKGFGSERILHDINQKLHTILPVGFFCCASIVDINYAWERIEIWNGGLLDVLLKKNDGRVLPFKSLHLPLGILSAEAFNAECVECDMKVGERIYLFSDGIVDLKDHEDNEFALNGFANFLLKNEEPELIFSHIVEQEKLSFERNVSNIDDVTFVEILMISEDVVSSKHELVQNNELLGARDWSMSFEMFNQTIRDFNPIPLMLHVTMEVPELRVFNNDVCMILSELITNGIDHGLLGLDSKLKNSSNGFQQYYDLRSERLTNLSGESLHISLRYLPNATGGVLVIRVVDTGAGFDFSQVDFDIPKASQMSGRGIPLLTRLCESIIYEGNGNTVEAVYRWVKLHDNNKL
jgi:CheY-like chemotaxis protein